VAPEWFSIDDPNSLRLIYGPGNGFTKSDWYYGFGHPDPKLFTLFSDRNPERHAAQRRKLGSAYTLSTLVSYEPFVDNCIDILITRFQELAQAGIEVDVGHWLQCYAFDVIGEITVS